MILTPKMRLFFFPVLSLPFAIYSCKPPTGVGSAPSFFNGKKPTEGVVATTIAMESVNDQGGLTSCSGVVICTSKNSETNPNPDSTASGSTKIYKTWILTAAHCVNKIEGRPVYIGPDKFNNKVQMCGIIKGFKHSNFIADPKAFDLNDIGVALIACPQKPSCVPITAQKVPVGKNVIMAGYGFQGKVGEGKGGKNDDDSGYLMQGEGAVVPPTQAEVDARVKGTEYRVQGAGTSHTNVGDSGGPLYVKAPNGSFILTGVLSRTTTENPDDPNAEVYSYFTAINPHLEWIQSKIGSNVDTAR